MSLLADGEGKVGERKRGMRRTSGCLRWDSWWSDMGSLRRSRGDGGDDRWRRRFGGVWQCLTGRLALVRGEEVSDGHGLGNRRRRKGAPR
jgi:hypothetical protein